MPMSSYPELHELVWLSEVEPEVLEPELGWPMSEVTFVTHQGGWEVRCSIGVYDYTVELNCLLEGNETVHLKLKEVDSIAFDRPHGAETLLVRPREGAGFGDVTIQLKPHVKVHADTALPWDGSPRNLPTTGTPMPPYRAAMLALGTIPEVPVEARLHELP